jgi:membrane-bound metal-dependent hydrolase YbcI (DUF457 family)
MPFTPFHLGPGALVKSVVGRHFSFMVYGGTQVLMDIEPLIGIIQHKPVLHGPTHTILGALAIGSVAAIIGKPIGTFVLRALRIPRFDLTWSASFIGACVSALSHVLLDALMHSDMNPWWPLSSGNGLLGIVTLDSLHRACAISGIVGASIIAAKLRVNGRACT